LKLHEGEKTVFYYSAEQIRKATWFDEAFIKPSRNDAHIEQVWRKVIEEHKLKRFPLRAGVLTNVLCPITAALRLL